MGRHSPAVAEPAQRWQALGWGGGCFAFPACPPCPSTSAWGTPFSIKHIRMALMLLLGSTERRRELPRRAKRASRQRSAASWAQGEMREAGWDGEHQGPASPSALLADFTSALGTAKELLSYRPQPNSTGLRTAPKHTRFSLSTLPSSSQLLLLYPTLPHVTQFLHLPP